MPLWQSPREPRWERHADRRCFHMETGLAAAQPQVLGAATSLSCNQEGSGEPALPPGRRQGTQAPRHHLCRPGLQQTAKLLCRARSGLLSPPGSSPALVAHAVLSGPPPPQRDRGGDRAAHRPGGHGWKASPPVGLLSTPATRQPPGPSAEGRHVTAKATKAPVAGVMAEDRRSDGDGRQRGSRTGFGDVLRARAAPLGREVGDAASCPNE